MSAPQPARAATVTSRRPAVALAAAVALLAAGCGVRGGATPATATSRSTPAALVAVLDRPLGVTPNTLRLVDMGGTPAASAPVPADAEVIAVAGSRVLVAGGGQVRAVDRSGRVVSTMPLPGDGPGDIVTRLVASADGTEWLYSSLHQNGDGTVRTTLYLSVRGATPEVVLTRTEAEQALEPAAWTAEGPVVADEPIGLGGYVLFRRVFGAAYLLDLSGGSTAPLEPASCAFSDLSAAGTVACVLDGREGPHDAGPVVLRLETAAHHDLDVPLDAGVAQAGAAFFDPQGDQVTLATSPVAGDGVEVVSTHLVDTVTGAMRRLGPDGVLPVGWLDATHVLAVRRPGSLGGPAGTYVISTGGEVTGVSSAWTVVGVVR